MPDIDRNIVCQQLIVDTSSRYVSQDREKTIYKKIKVTTSTVKGLLYTHFIYETNYTKWLSYVVLVRKAS